MTIIANGDTLKKTFNCTFKFIYLFIYLYFNFGEQMDFQNWMYICR